MGAVIAPHHQPAGRSVEMPAPVGNEPIRAAGRDPGGVAAVSAVAADDVIGNAGREGQILHGFHKTIVRREPVHAVGEDMDLQVSGVENRASEEVISRFGQELRWGAASGGGLGRVLLRTEKGKRPRGGREFAREGPRPVRCFPGRRPGDQNEKLRPTTGPWLTVSIRKPPLS